MILLRSEISRVVRCTGHKSEPTPEASSVQSHKQDALFPLVGIDLPKSWVELEKAIMKYRENLQPPEVPCMTFEQFEKFALEKAGLRGSEVVSGLNYLDSIGEVRQPCDWFLSAWLDEKICLRIMSLLCQLTIELITDYVG